MNRKLLIFMIALICIVLISLLPIFPLISEVREFSQNGESLYQTGNFVSMPEFYDASRFAMSGWLDSTWTYYLILAVVNHAGLVFLFLFAQNLLSRVFS